MRGLLQVQNQCGGLLGEFQASEQFCLRKYNRKQLKKTAHIGCLPSRYACAQHTGLLSLEELCHCWRRPGGIDLHCHRDISDYSSTLN